MPKLTKKQITINDLKINSIQAGEENNQHLLFLHGKAFDSTIWEQLGTITLLANHGFHVTAIDLPGFGKTPKSQQPHTETIFKVIKELSLNKTTLIGPSMSGEIALDFVIKHPELIESLIVIGAVGVNDKKNDLPLIKNKTLAIWGENDQIADKQDGETINSLVPNSELFVIQGATHPCYIDETKIFHEKLISFVQK